jgi:DNA polymerase III sliding clamp (beta) subunit (PCNA family)
LIDVLSAIGTPQVVIETSGSSSPGVLKPAGEQNSLHVVMPMHIAR